jgi:maltokinase
MTTPGDEAPHPHPLLDAFLANARWFGGKGRPFMVSDVRRAATLAGPPTITVELVTVSYRDAAGETVGTELYQVPLVHYSEPQPRLEHAQVGSWNDGELGDVHAYDVIHDREAMAVYLHTFAAAAETGEAVEGPLHFHRLPGHELDLEAMSTPFSGEQSNSSIAFGEDSLLKLFRKVTPGSNPDIEIHRALTEAGSEHVAALFGWLDLEGLDGHEGDKGAAQTGEPVQLAMLQQFLRTASDGWGLALASVRNLFNEGDLHADEVGGDFAAESHRLGAAVAEVHAVLREHFPTTALDAADAAEAMRARLDAAVAAVPELEPHADAARVLFDSLAELHGHETELGASLASQRIHGDLHLGQTLRTSLGWKLVDFEGEPAKPLADRVLPDSPWRDVAGMLRSFDYAAKSVERDLPHDPESAPQLRYRSQEWVARNSEAFLAGYAEQRGAPWTPEEHRLIAAYVADKAIYEVVYEARNRPGWIDIPLAALERLRKEEEA